MQFTYTYPKMMPADGCHKVYDMMNLPFSPAFSLKGLIPRLPFGTHQPTDICACAIKRLTSFFVSVVANSVFITFMTALKNRALTSYSVNCFSGSLIHWSGIQDIADILAPHFLMEGDIDRTG
ncbi:hypothetical protein IRP16_004142 [Salmonella enterica]|nr:hypothetical protein [Salmonella enterica]EGM2345079.1 hypothetical protein [Salmonella enterica]EGM2363771.1 hypothetical protein [Salmonella enterica]